MVWKERGIWGKRIVDNSYSQRLWIMCISAIAPLLARDKDRRKNSISFSQLFCGYCE